jgi:hypothetical protein
VKHIVDEMWKQWQIGGGKEKGKENADDEEETTLSKVDKKVKVVQKRRMTKARRKRLAHATTVE